jgi:hypothetical protein
MLSQLLPILIISAIFGLYTLWQAIVYLKDKYDH